MSRHSHSVNILMDTAHYDKLCALATAQSVSRGAYVRALIRYAHLHTFQKVPTCANGGRCYVSHMHRDEPKPNTTEVPAP